jgi:hypothetical protein
MIAIACQPASPARHGACAALLLVLLAAAPAAAVQTVRPYDVTTSSTDQAAAFDEAIRVALVRATGRRDAPDAPAFAALRAEPRRFVQVFRPVSGRLRVTLDAAALDRAIVAAGGRLWPRTREVVLVGFEADAVARAGDAWQGEVELAADARGLPVQIASTAFDAGLDAGAALAAARAVQADAALIASAAAGPSPGEWQWRFVTRAGVDQWTGSAAAAIDSAADRIATAAIEFMGQPELDAIVEVSGVATLADYARASRLLAAVPGVRGVVPLELRAGTVLFSVAVRGGATGLVDALATHPQLSAAAAGGDRLGYLLRPD